MRASIRITICVFGAVLALLFTAGASVGSLLPDGLVMQEAFQPGYGHPVGKVQLVQGEAVIVHAGEMLGYWAEKDLPLFKGDTIVTKARGRIKFILNDKSVITLSASTKLAITQSVYDPENTIRSSFINMVLGKARFWAKKLADFQSSQFKVKSMTAIIGVRGSEWIEVVTEDSTRVITGPDTRLEVVPLVAPEKSPTVMESFQDTTIEEGRLPSEVETITPEEYDRLQESFEMLEDQIAVSVPPQPEAQKEVGKEGVSAETEEVLVPDQELVYPAPIEKQEIAKETLTPGIIEQQEQAEQIAELAEQQEVINEQIAEESVVLPDFPAPPP